MKKDKSVRLRQDHRHGLDDAMKMGVKMRDVAVWAQL